MNEFPKLFDSTIRRFVRKAGYMCRSQMEYDEQVQVGTLAVIERLNREHAEPDAIPETQYEDYAKTASNAVQAHDGRLKAQMRLGIPIDTFDHNEWEDNKPEFVEYGEFPELERLKRLGGVVIEVIRLRESEYSFETIGLMLGMERDEAEKTYQKGIAAARKALDVGDGFWPEVDDDKVKAACVVEIEDKPQRKRSEKKEYGFDFGGSDGS